MKRLVTGLAMGTTALCPMAGPLQAQEAQDTVVLAPITIVALRRNDDAYALPASVTVIDDQVTTDSLDPGAAITRAAPNFYYASNGQPGTDFVSMRGIGPLGQPANSLDNVIGVATNGVPSSSLGFPGSLLDVQRIEVLRGPQGTLAGRNALGGLVNVVTAPADGESIRRLRTEFGSDGYYLGELTWGGWLQQDVLAGRLAARITSQDGDIPNAINGRDEGGSRLDAARATLRWTPADSDTSVNFTLSHDTERRNSSYVMFYEAPGFPVSAADTEPLSERKRTEAMLEVTHDFGNFVLTSQTGYQDIGLNGRYDVSDDLLFDAGFGFVPPHGADLGYSDDTERMFSQELRLNAVEGSTIDWVVGLSYFQSEFRSNRDQNSSFSVYSSGLFDTRIDSKTYAVFGDVTAPLGERMRVSAGLRYARDEQDFTAIYESKGFPGSVASYRQDSDTSDDYFTGRLALNYDVSDSLTTYASVARGYASGGFERFALNSAVGEPTIPFRPSTSLTYEIGAKSRHFDDRLDLSFALFHNDIKDGQLVAADMAAIPTVFHFVNQDYRSYGFELQGGGQITDRLHLSAGLGVTKTKLGNVDETAEYGAVRGNRVPNAPKVTGNINLTYDFTDQWRADVQYQYVGGRQVDIANSWELPSYDMLNARITYRADNLEFYVFGNNLLDERPIFMGSSYSDTVHAVTVGRGRMVGAGLTVTF